MANKTLKFFGNGYSPTGNAAVIVTFDSNTVFTGEIPTLDTDEFLPVPPEPNSQQEIFSFEVDESTYGTFPMSIEVTAGEFVVSSYSESSGAGNPPNPAEYYMLVNDIQQTDNRFDVAIDGVPQSKGPSADTLVGPWYYTIPNSSILTCNINILPYANVIGNVSGNVSGNVTP